MSTESSSNLPGSEYLTPQIYPISEKPITDAIAWLTYFMQNPEPRLVAFEEEMEKKDPILANYLTDMATLRGQLLFTEEQLVLYRQGALFGVKVLENQYESVKSTLPTSNEKANASYFKSLLRNANILGDKDTRYTVLIATQPSMVKGPMTPNTLTKMFQEKPVDPLLVAIKATFEQNTATKNEQMLSFEPEISSAVNAINNVMGQYQRGFYQGIVDMYWPFRTDLTVGPYVEILDEMEF